MLYAQQWAWLNSRAKDQKKSRASFLDDDVADRLPDVGPFSYIIDLLVKVGVAMNSGSGVHAITWQEIYAFTQSTSIRLSLWEAETIKKLSAVYANAIMQFDNKDVPAPYISEAEKQRLASSMKSTLRNIVVKDRDVR